MKPFSPREVVARVQAILRRTRAAAPKPTQAVMSQGRLTLDPESWIARWGE